MTLVPSQEATTNSGVTPYIIPSDFELDENIVSRYRRKKYEELALEFTREKDYLHQYYAVRAKEYNAIYGTVDYPTDETEGDRNGQVMVVRSGNFVIGGCRINIKSPRRPEPLPMEKDGFNIETHFPRLAHKEISYCQVSGFSLLEEFRGGSVIFEMGKRLANKCVASDISMLFAVCPILNARLYKKDFMAIGLKPKIHFDIDVPFFHELKEMGKLYLFSVGFNKESEEKNIKVMADANDILQPVS